MNIETKMKQARSNDVDTSFATMSTLSEEEHEEMTLVDYLPISQQKYFRNYYQADESITIAYSIDSTAWP